MSDRTEQHAVAIEALLAEDRTFPPSEEFRKQANISDPEIYERALQDPEAFWAEQAESLSWFRKWDTVLEWDEPFAKWFVGGKLNASYNCLDRHVEAGLGDRVAYYWEGEDGDRRESVRPAALRWPDNAERGTVVGGVDPQHRSRVGPDSQR